METVDSRLRAAKPIGTYTSAQEFISSFVEGKTVLDVGCAAGIYSREERDCWLHKHLCKRAVRVVGLDCNAPEVARLNRLGYNIVCGDAVTLDLGERFDCVVAGEIIEHVENAGALICNLKRHLKPGGELLLTTPNVFFALHFLESVLADPAKRWCQEHVSWYCYFTLGNILDRCGMRVIESRYLTRSRKVLGLLRRFRLKCLGVLASTLLMIAVDGQSERGNQTPDSAR
jgi:2-polyprenyl-3-methyl-5-hydroxy-6-metoxy-1,4-benzoquinol methylase